MSQKEAERADLAEFLKRSGIGFVETEGDRERPDFLGTCDGKSVAIEHTRVTDGDEPSTAAIGYLKRDLTAELQRRSLGVKILFGCPTGAGSLFRTTKARAELVTGIVDVVERAAANGEDMVTEGIAPLNRVAIEPSDGKEAAYWMHSKLGSGPSIVRAAIKKKGEDLAQYRGEVVADAYWLLLIAGPGVDAMVASGEFEGHGFDRVFLIDWFYPTENRDGYAELKLKE